MIRDLFFFYFLLCLSEFYPAEEFLRIWKLMLLNQFHDILPGSCIKEVKMSTSRRVILKQGKWVIQFKVFSCHFVSLSFKLSHPGWLTRVTTTGPCHMSLSLLHVLVSYWHGSLSLKDLYCLSLTFSHNLFTITNRYHCRYYFDMSKSPFATLHNVLLLVTAACHIQNPYHCCCACQLGFSVPYTESTWKYQASKESFFM